MTDVDRSAEQAYSAFHDFDGAIYTGTKTTRVGKQDFH
jgi:hypothetical protein